MGARAWVMYENTDETVDVHMSERGGRGSLFEKIEPSNLYPLCVSVEPAASRITPEEWCRQFDYFQIDTVYLVSNGGETIRGFETVPLMERPAESQTGLLLEADDTDELGTLGPDIYAAEDDARRYKQGYGPDSDKAAFVSAVQLDLGRQAEGRVPEFSPFAEHFQQVVSLAVSKARGEGQSTTQ